MDQYSSNAAMARLTAMEKTMTSQTSKITSFQSNSLTKKVQIAKLMNLDKQKRFSGPWKYRSCAHRNSGCKAG
jgi:hypothetical protein